MRYLRHIYDRFLFAIWAFLYAEELDEFRRNLTYRNVPAVSVWTYLPALRDMCQVCSGKMGGVYGNENIVDNVVICDYCDAIDNRLGECA